ncbi:MAG: DUF805 domain-containing protein [Chloroflexota bacterium]
MGAVWVAYIISFALTLVSAELGLILSFVILVGAIIPGLAVAVRRLHDTGRSGWWMLLGLVDAAGAGAVPGPGPDRPPGAR